ncbi:MAG: hypothetical protein OHK93_005735 [Ramalina farinacea]|uniref:Uncharacterized protein n=1 Tax=Ramalina farinacea TaxID=258253 RepID=A0AA43QIX9_9LECA|nr:hypothetical protein [Ramalina farinacea]
MASSANNGGKPWKDRRERDQYFINKRANDSRDQNANQNPPWVPHQQWSPYQQQPYVPPVTYVHTTTVYGGYAPPLGHYTSNQRGNSNQYMPPGFTPYPAAYNSSWGQPAAVNPPWVQPAAFNPPWGQSAPPMPNQQGPYTVNRARQRAPPRPPPPGFVSEEDENAASSSNNGVGSLPKKSGTSQTPLETPESPVTSKPSPSSRPTERSKTLMNTVASAVNQDSTMTEHPKTPTNTVASRPPPASRPTERPRTAIATVLPGAPQDSTLMERVRSILKERTENLVVSHQRFTTTSATSPSCGPVPKDNPAELLAWIADRKAAKEANVIQPSSASPHTSADHELYEPKEIAKPTLHTGPREAPKQADLQDEPIYDDILPPSSIRSSLPPSNMEIDSSSLSDHHTPPQRFTSPINGSVRQTVVSPLYNKRKRMTPSHFEPEDESQETALRKDPPAAKRVQHTEQVEQPLEPDAMMLSTQDTPTVGQTTSQAESIDNEVKGSESSFHRGVADAVKLDRRSLRKRNV